MDVLQRAQPGDDPRQHDDRQIGLVLLHARIAHRQDLVGGGGEAHDALAVQRAVVVDIALGQLELDFGLESRDASLMDSSYFTRSMPSLASSSSSIITSLPLPLRSLGSYLIGQASEMTKRALFGLAGFVEHADRDVRRRLADQARRDVVVPFEQLERIGAVVIPAFSVMLPYLVRPESLRTCGGSVPSR